MQGQETAGAARIAAGVPSGYRRSHYLMEYKDYYATLGVEREADERKIRDAYRKLARRYHPDVNPGDKAAEDKFKEINEAYQVLSDAGKRKKYDALGSDWERISRDEDLWRRYRAEGVGAEEATDFFTTFFGGAGPGMGGVWDSIFRGEGAGDKRGLDVEAELPISLVEAADGITRRLELQVEDVCGTCKGSGMTAVAAPRRGNPRVRYNARPCATCRGAGVVRALRVINARVPAGVADGSRLRLAGQGGRGADGGSGDLFVRVRLLPHPVFTVHGRDLSCELPVWDFEAALGAEVDAPTLKGRVRVRVPAGCQNGQTLRLRGKGLPAGKGAATGDLLYAVRVVVPTSLDADEQRLFGELRERVTKRAADPRAGILRPREPDEQRERRRR